MEIELIVAHDRSRGIGKGNDLPWFLPGELKFVASTTKSTTDPNKVNVLIMGRRTYESIPASRRPLPGRKSIVVSSGYSTTDPVLVCSSLDVAIACAKEDPDVEKAIIFGGGTIYRQALDNGVVDRLYVTEIDNEYGCDSYFPEIPGSYIEISSEDVDGFDFRVTRKVYERQ